MEQTLMDKLTILADSAKYDVACTSSGASRTAQAGILGSCYAPGCCHAFTGGYYSIRQAIMNPPIRQSAWRRSSFRIRLRILISLRAC